MMGMIDVLHTHQNSIHRFNQRAFLQPQLVIQFDQLVLHVVAYFSYQPKTPLVELLKELREVVFVGYVSRREQVYSLSDLTD